MNIFEYVLSLLKRRRNSYSEQFSDALMEAFPVVVISADGIIEKVSPLFMEVMNYSREEITGVPYAMLCPESVIKSGEYEVFWQRLYSGERIRETSCRFARGCRPVWIDAHYVPITDSKGKLARIINIALRVSDRLHSPDEMESMVNAISRSMAIISFDPDGVILDANENFLKTTGYERNEVVGKHHRIFCSETLSGSSEYLQFWHKLNQGEFMSGQFPRLNCSGKPLWLNATYNPVFNSDGQLYKIVKFATDVTGQIIRHQREHDAAAAACNLAIQTRGSAQEGFNVIENSIRTINQIAGDMTAVSSDISKLNRQSDSIDGIVGTIRSFAMQTRLIAFNAAIEAARAGDYGRSFEVVAGEIRTLADNVSDATIEIESVVASNNLLAKDALRAIEISQKSTALGEKMIREAGEHITSIRINSEKVEIAVKDVANSIDG